MAVVARQDARLHKRVASVMEAYMGAADLEDNGAPVDPDMKVEKDGRPVGWSHRKYRVARDGRIPVREQPGYLAAAQRMLESYARKDAHAVHAPTLAVAVTVHVGSQAAKEQVTDAQYRVIDATDEERR